MSVAPVLRRLSIVAVAATLGSSLLVGAAGAATPPVDFSPAPGGPTAQRAPSVTGGVAAQTTVDQGATRRDASIVTQGGLVAGTPEGLQITSTQATQDLVGQRLVAVSTYRTTPQPSFVNTYFGQTRGGSCVRRAVVVGTTDGNGTGAFFDADGQGPTATFGITSVLTGNTLTVTSAASNVFRDADWDCAWSVVGNAAGDGVQQFLAADLTTTYIPQLTISTVDPVQGNYSGRWTTVSLDAANNGRADAVGTRVTASGSGLTFNRRSVTIGTLGDRRSRYGITFKVKPTSKKSRTATFTITSAGGHTARARVTIVRKPQATRPSSLSGRSYWGNDPRDRSKGWDQRGITFVDKKWAYVGFATTGAPSCRRTTKICKRYTYAGGRVKIAGRPRVKITSEGFRLKGVDYSPLATPRKNAKLSVALHHQDFRGCGSNLYCSTYTETLSMGRDGRFVLTDVGISSIGVPGVGTISSRVGPDQRGRYQVLSKGRIRLSYDSGKRVTTSVGVELDVRGKASPGGAGLVIGGTNYYRPR